MKKPYYKDFFRFFVVGMKYSSIGGTVEDPLEANPEDTTSSTTTLRTKRASSYRNKKIEQWRNVEKRTTW